MLDTSNERNNDFPHDMLFEYSPENVISKHEIEEG